MKEFARTKSAVAILFLALVLSIAATTVTTYTLFAAADSSDVRLLVSNDDKGDNSPDAMNWAG